MEEHLGKLFTEEEPLEAEQDEERITVANQWDESLVGVLYELPSADDEDLVEENASKDDWISRDGRQRREQRLEKVNIEALLIASGQNIKRLVAARGRGPRKLAAAVALRPPNTVSRCRAHVTGRWPNFARTKAYFNRLTSLEVVLCKILQANFAEFTFHALR